MSAQSCKLMVAGDPDRTAPGRQSLHISLGNELLDLGLGETQPPGHLVLGVMNPVQRCPESMDKLAHVIIRPEV